ncbi:MAG: serpin family protein, partial [Planctomycetaceae bacterium]|nr:serpin family protein [Planctomycetaceae bacterium]
MRSQWYKNVTTRVAQVMFVVIFFASIVISSSASAADQLALFRNAASGNTKDNVSISPYGANLALALVVPGTKGDTETELKSLLGYEGDISELAKSLKITEYAQDGSPLKTATSLWVQQGFNVFPAFTDTAKKNFASEIQNVDFIANSNAACNSINEWVDKNTMSKIKKLFNELSSDTRLIAISAIYFLADWRTKFKTNETKEEDFTLLNGEKKKVQMMRNNKVNFNYGVGLNATWIEMPYKNNGFSAVVILPNKGVDPADMIENFSPIDFINTLKTMK